MKKVISIHKIINRVYCSFPIMRSLHDVHEMNACRTNGVCPSVCMFQLENLWTDFDETWHECYAIGG
jgi:hypothetical protein